MFLGKEVLHLDGVILDFLFSGDQGDFGAPLLGFLEIAAEFARLIGKVGLKSRHTETLGEMEAMFHGHVPKGHQVDIEIGFGEIKSLIF